MINELLDMQIANTYGGNICRCNGVVVNSHKAVKFAIDCQKICCIDKLAETWQWIGEYGGTLEGFCHNSSNRHWFLDKLKSVLPFQCLP